MTARKSSRLPGEALEDGPLYNLMTRNNGTVPMPVYLKDVRRSIAGLSLKVFFTDADLRPITTGLPSTAHDNFWRPKRPLPLSSKKGNGETHIGYFLPYADVFDDELLTAESSLSQLV